MISTQDRRDAVTLIVLKAHDLQHHRGNTGNTLAEKKTGTKAGF